ncbi:MAG: hypothetical protein AB1716_05935 [Planctomycetota bacterium]
MSVGPVQATGRASGDPNTAMTVSLSGSGAASHTGDPNAPITLVQVPVHNAERSDTAIFDLSSSQPLPINAVGATAGRIVVSNSSLDITAGASAAATSETEPSVTVDSGGRLNVVAGTLESVHTIIGLASASPSQALVSNEGTRWENEGRMTVGHGGPGRLFVFDGFLGSAEARIGGPNGAGDAQVSGPHALWNTGNIAVGFGGQPGTLTIDNGGTVSSGLLNAFSVIGLAAGSGNRVSVQGVDPNSGQASTWTVDGELRVGDAGEGTLEILDGGTVSSGLLVVANGAATGTVVVRGRSANGEPSRLHTIQTRADIGEQGIGSLQVMDGAEALFEGDLSAGIGGDATIVVSGFAQSGGQERLDQPARLQGEAGLSLGQGAAATLQVQRGGLVDIRQDITVKPARDFQRAAGHGLYQHQRRRAERAGAHARAGRPADGSRRRVALAAAVSRPQCVACVGVVRSPGHLACGSAGALRSHQSPASSATKGVMSPNSTRPLPLQSPLRMLQAGCC